MSNDSDGQKTIKDLGYGDGWTFRGKDTYKKGDIRSFKLVKVGPQNNLEDVRRACNERGMVPDGIWLQVFADTFENDGDGPIGVADPSWEDPHGLADFPMVHSDGGRFFGWVDFYRGEDWRWLVAVSSSESPDPSGLSSRLASLESDMKRLKEIINL
jgi:hypothetical protein